jgi:hypothetical protein
MELVRQGREYASIAPTCRVKIAEHAFGFIKEDAVVCSGRSDLAVININDVVDPNPLILAGSHASITASQQTEANLSLRDRSTTERHGVRARHRSRGNL